MRSPAESERIAAQTTNLVPPVRSGGLAPALLGGLTGGAGAGGDLGPGVPELAKPSYDVGEGPVQLAGNGG